MPVATAAPSVTGALRGAGAPTTRVDAARLAPRQGGAALESCDRCGMQLTRLAMKYHTQVCRGQGSLRAADASPATELSSNPPRTPPQVATRRQSLISSDQVPSVSVVLRAIDANTATVAAGRGDTAYSKLPRTTFAPPSVSDDSTSTFGGIPTPQEVARGVHHTQSAHLQSASIPASAASRFRIDAAVPLQSPDAPHAAPPPTRAMPSDPIPRVLFGAPFGISLAPKTHDDGGVSIPNEPASKIAPNEPAAVTHASTAATTTGLSSPQSSHSFVGAPAGAADDTPGLSLTQRYVQSALQTVVARVLPDMVNAAVEGVGAESRAAWEAEMRSRLRAAQQAAAAASDAATKCAQSQRTAAEASASATAAAAQTQQQRQQQRDEVGPAATLAVTTAEVERVVSAQLTHHRRELSSAMLKQTEAQTRGELDLFLRYVEGLLQQQRETLQTAATSAASEYFAAQQPAQAAAAERLSSRVAAAERVAKAASDRAHRAERCAAENESALRAEVAAAVDAAMRAARDQIRQEVRLEVQRELRAEIRDMCSQAIANLRSELREELRNASRGAFESQRSHLDTAGRRGGEDIHHSDGKVNNGAPASRRALASPTAPEADTPPRLAATSAASAAAVTVQEKRNEATPHNPQRSPAGARNRERIGALEEIVGGLAASLTEQLQALKTQLQAVADATAARRGDRPSVTRRIVDAWPRRLGESPAGGLRPPSASASPSPGDMPEGRTDDGALTQLRDEVRLLRAAVSARREESAARARRDRPANQLGASPEPADPAVARPLAQEMQAAAVSDAPSSQPGRAPELHSSAEPIGAAGRAASASVYYYPSGSGGARDGRAPSEPRARSVPAAAFLRLAAQDNALRRLGVPPGTVPPSIERSMEPSCSSHQPRDTSTSSPVDQSPPPPPGATVEF